MKLEDMKNRGKRGKNRRGGLLTVKLFVHFSDFLISSHPRSTSISMLHITITDTRLFLGNSLLIVSLYITRRIQAPFQPKTSIKTNTAAHRQTRNTVLDCKTSRKLIKIPSRAVGEKHQFPFIKASSLDVAQRSGRNYSTTEIPI